MDTKLLQYMDDIVVAGVSNEDISQYLESVILLLESILVRIEEKNRESVQARYIVLVISLLVNILIRIEEKKRESVQGSLEE